MKLYFTMPSNFVEKVDFKNGKFCKSGSTSIFLNGDIEGFEALRDALTMQINNPGDHVAPTFALEDYQCQFYPENDARVIQESKVAIMTVCALEKSLQFKPNDVENE